MTTASATTASRHRSLPFPTPATKGADTVWDAPGMQRIKIPFGGLNPEQMDVLADIAEEYSDAICHITTRQDVQLHYVHIDDAPDLMRRLASVGITSARGLRQRGAQRHRLLRWPASAAARPSIPRPTPRPWPTTCWAIRTPRKWAASSRSPSPAARPRSCGLTNIHDLGFIAKTWQANGVTHRGFEVVIGGGLGAVPYDAKLFDAAVPEEEILPLAQATCRVFARLGEKRNRGRARMKFLIEKIGFEEFRRLVLEERKLLPPRSALDRVPQGRRALPRDLGQSPPRAWSSPISIRSSRPGARPTCMPSGSPATSSPR